MERPPSHQVEPISGGKLWQCGQCSSTFSRFDHLKRHTVTHNTEKSHACHFCGALFGRGDVLRRHWKSCKIRLEKGLDIPEGHRGGKHKRACDSCAGIRKACNGENPCAECTQRGRTCTYQRLYEDSDFTSKKSSGAQEVQVEDYSMGLSGPVTESSWDLGVQSFYPPTANGRVVYARRGL